MLSTYIVTLWYKLINQKYSMPVLDYTLNIVHMKSNGFCIPQKIVFKNVKNIYLQAKNQPLISI